MRFKKKRRLDATARVENEKAVRSTKRWVKKHGAALIFVLIPPNELEEDRYVAFTEFLDAEEIG